MKWLTSFEAAAAAAAAVAAEADVGRSKSEKILEKRNPVELAGG